MPSAGSAASSCHSAAALLPSPRRLAISASSRVARGRNSAGKPASRALNARQMRALIIAAPLQEFRQAKEIERIFRGKRLPLVEQGIDLSKKRGESPQVHLIVLHHARKRVGGASAQIIKIKTAGSALEATSSPRLPAEPLRVEHMALQFPRVARNPGAISKARAPDAANPGVRQAAAL